VNPAVLNILVAFEVLVAAVGATITWFTICLYKTGRIHPGFIAAPVAQTVVALTPVALVLAGASPPPLVFASAAALSVALSLPFLWRRRRDIRRGLGRGPVTR
jgi:hypothetical protein